ncbi:unnamed protein product [Rotaria magnacalcarata]|uniref:HAT C-terminal dimerisation domain-containing protein n=1 Tax=Rotaria magnacalcarata TaxID=392030 RepID=A0A816NW23_9BILA|nr:unnamed protein product [Rotaria magnacalcarata]
MLYSRIDRDLLHDMLEFLFPFDTVLQTLGDSKRLAEKWELFNEHLIATLIHLNLKHFRMCPDLKERAIVLLKQEMLKHQNASSACTSAMKHSSTISSKVSSISCSSSSTSITITDPISVRKQLLIEIFDKKSTVPEKSTAEQELEKYLASTSILKAEAEDDILEYWKENQQSFPLITSNPRDILAIPAFNTSVERLFSSCKKNITDTPTKLGAEKLSKIMFLQKNMNILNEKCGAYFTATSDGQHEQKRYDAAI